MISRTAHVVTEEGKTFAVGFDANEQIVCAMEVIDVEQHYLDDQVVAAWQAFDDVQYALCETLSHQLHWGEAQEIGHYFTVSV